MAYRIAICGKMRSGKGTIARHLFLEHGFKEVAFADRLKTIADELFLGTETYPSEKIYKECPFSEGGKAVVGEKKPRRLYQDVGEKLRELDPLVWVRQAEKTILFYENYKDHIGVVISDLRLPIEEQWAKDNGFIIIRVNADESDRLARIERAGDDFKAEDLRHETEQYVDSIEADYDIWNGEGVSEGELRRKVDEIMNEINPTP